MPVFKRKNTYYIDFYHNGKRYRKRIGENKKNAEIKLKDIEVKLYKGEYLGITEIDKILFEDFTKKYLDYAKINKEPSTYAADEKRLKANLLPYFSGKYLHQINISMIEDFKKMRAEKAIQGSTINRDLALLKHMFTIAIDTEFALSNPVKKIKFFKESDGRTRFLNQEEINSLLNQCSGMLKTIVLTAIHTGMRRGEIFNLKWQDIDIVNRDITVSRTKNNLVRHIPISDALFDELILLPRKSEFVFCSDNGSQLQIKDIRTEFEHALKRAKLTGVCWYTFRHTYASHLVMNGADPRTLADLLGDKTLQMVMRYAHLSPGHKREVVNKMTSSLIWSQIGHKSDIL